MGKKVDISGKRFNYLTVISEHPLRSSDGRVRWNCVCVCGKPTITIGKELRNSHVKSCGCIRKDSQKIGENHPNWKGGYKNKGSLAWANVTLAKMRANSKRYGYEGPPAEISGKDLLNMYNNSNGVCAICKEFTEKPCIDHNHKTGQLRGILCISCNTGIGFLKDCPEKLKAASEYLKTEETVLA